MRPHLLSLGALMLSACTVLTPPPRALPLETVSPVGEGRTGEQFTFAKDTSGVDVDTGAVSLRHGFDPDTDVNVEATGWTLPSYEKDAGNSRQRVWSGHAGAKRRVARFLALEAGVGGGGIAGTPFVGPDAAVIVAWENRFVVPFLALRGVASVPVHATIVRPGDDSSKLLPELYGQLALGGRVPIGWTAPRPGQLRGSLLGGAGWTWYGDVRNSGRIDGFAFGAEITF
ncbi:MAG TPA: hypothetical protein VKU41_05510 [Polyangiaceae bacterium]|nr:hypothetical protein [Polyangiaceae bacterium]